MTSPRNWNERDLDGIFNRVAEQVEMLAREFAPILLDVNMALDIDSRQPVIRFVFADNTAPDLDRLPQKISGHKVVPTFKT